MATDAVSDALGEALKSRLVAHLSLTLPDTKIGLDLFSPIEFPT
jgi:hypothetical protein